MQMLFLWEFNAYKNCLFAILIYICSFCPISMVFFNIFCSVQVNYCTVISYNIYFVRQVLLGDVGAGKSSLVLRFVKGQFVEFQVGVIRDLGPKHLIREIFFWILELDFCVGMFRNQPLVLLSSHKHWL